MVGDSGAGFSAVIWFMDVIPGPKSHHSFQINRISSKPKAIIKISNNNNKPNSGSIVLKSSCSTALRPALTPIKTTGMMTGKVRTGKRTPGLSVLVAMLLLMVKMEEMPMPVVRVMSKKVPPLLMLPCMRLNTAKAKVVKISINRAEVSRRAPKKTCGEQSWCQKAKLPLRICMKALEIPCSVVKITTTQKMAEYCSGSMPGKLRKVIRTAVKIYRKAPTIAYLPFHSSTRKNFTICFIATKIKNCTFAQK